MPGRSRTFDCRSHAFLLNLLSNSCKFTKQGEVALRARKVVKGRDWIEFAVSDTGIGMTAEQQAKNRRSHPAEKTPDTWALGTRGARQRFGTPPPLYQENRGGYPRGVGRTPHR